jgi:hypothetical protein
MELLGLLAELLLAVFELDERPSARRFTWGCMLTLVAVLLAVFAWQHMR